MTTPTLQGGTPGSLLDEHIEPFLKHLCAAGYAERTLRKKRTVAEAFARWARRKYKRLRYRKTASVHWLGRLAQRDPSLLYLWRIGIRPAAGR